MVWLERRRVRGGGEGRRENATAIGTLQRDTGRCHHQGARDDIRGSVGRAGRLTGQIKAVGNNRWEQVGLIKVHNGNNVALPKEPK